MTHRTALILAGGLVLATIIYAVSTRYQAHIDNDAFFTVITDRWTGEHWTYSNIKRH